jgi:hypothetical protein
MHDLVNPSRIEKSLIADQKNLAPTEAARTGTNLMKKAPAKNNLRDLEFAMMESNIYSFHI